MAHSLRAQSPVGQDQEHRSHVTNFSALLTPLTTHWHTRTDPPPLTSCLLLWEISIFSLISLIFSSLPPSLHFPLPLSRRCNRWSWRVGESHLWLFQVEPSLHQIFLLLSQTSIAKTLSWPFRIVSGESFFPWTEKNVFATSVFLALKFKSRHGFERWGCVHIDLHNRNSRSLSLSLSLSI